MFMYTYICMYVCMYIYICIYVCIYSIFRQLLIKQTFEKNKSVRAGSDSWV